MGHGRHDDARSVPPRRPDEPQLSGAAAALTGPVAGQAARAPGWLTRAAPGLLYGIRVWASVCLTLFVGFKLELDSPYWAATSAAIVCQPNLGASLRKGGFRMIGTLIGAVAIVVMTAAFPQSRVGFLAALAIWIGLCGFVAAILRNFAGYAAALAGYTAAIIFATSSTDPTQTFILAVNRGSEICLGIVCAGIVLAGTDFGTARFRLAQQIAAMVHGCARGLAETLDETPPDYDIMRDRRRVLVLETATLDPVIDEAIGEASDLRARSGTLQRAVDGLVQALSGWRTVANHRQMRRQQGRPPATGFPRPAFPDAALMANNPSAARRMLLEDVKILVGYQAPEPSLRLIADRAAEGLLGLCRSLQGLSLLVQPDLVHGMDHSARPRVGDLLPAVLGGLRATALIAVLELFWVATAWQGGQLSITFAAVVITLFSPREDQAYGLALGFAEGTIIAVALVAIMEFAVLPGMEGFLPLCLVLAVALIPLAALSTGAWQKPAFTAMMMNFLPLFSPSNLPVYNLANFFNTALAICVGTVAAAMAMRLLPPLSPATKIIRLHRLTIRDFRRMVSPDMRRRPDWPRVAWENRIYARLLTLPATATVLDSAQLLAAMSAGEEILRLRGLSAVLAQAPAMRTLEAYLQHGRIAGAVSALQDLRAAIAAVVPQGPAQQRALASADVLAETLTRHGEYLGGAL
jgi:uncharacterized membrane protein YccC